MEQSLSLLSVPELQHSVQPVVPSLLLCWCWGRKVLKITEWRFLQSCQWLFPAIDFMLSSFSSYFVYHAATEVITCFLRIFSEFLDAASFITHPPPLLYDKPFLVSGTSDSIEVLWDMFFREKKTLAGVIVGSACVGVRWEFKFALTN